MKKIITITIILMTLTACSVFQVEKTESAGTATPPNMPNPAAVDCEIGKQLVIQTAADGSQSIECVDPDGSAPSMPNPASVYCEENGNQLEIQTAADGGQTGVCIFPDGSVCDEWAYFRGECVDPDGSAPSMPNPAAVDCEIGKQLVIQTAADGSQSSECVDLDGSGGYMPPGTTEEIANWWGVIKSTESGAQYDDYFEWQDLRAGHLLWHRFNGSGGTSADQGVARHLARSFISMAHYLAMCLTTTARRSRWIASRLKGNELSHSE